MALRRSSFLEGFEGGRSRRRVSEADGLVQLPWLAYVQLWAEEGSAMKCSIESGTRMECVNTAQYDYFEI